MAKRKIDAKEALIDILSGMDDQSLMAKYRLSAKGIESLVRKLLADGLISQAEVDRRMPHLSATVSVTEMTERGLRYDPHSKEGKEVRAQEAVRDIRSGMSDADLMEKYRLTARGLQSLLDQLVKAGALKPTEIEKRVPWSDTTVDLRGVIKRLGLDTTDGPEGPVDVPARCVACGSPQTMEFETCPVCGVNIHEFKDKLVRGGGAAAAAWNCPACGRPQERPYDECPVCGVIVSKLEKKNSGKKSGGFD